MFKNAIYFFHLAAECRHFGHGRSLARIITTTREEGPAGPEEACLGKRCLGAPRPIRKACGKSSQPARSSDKPVGMVVSSYN